jgi:Domain of unknown function (DUF5615)
VAGFYSDSHVSWPALARLQDFGHDVVRCQQVGNKDAEDEDHLLYASINAITLITSDSDYEQLHRAWCKWSVAWQVTINHAGILIVPTTQFWTPEETAEAIDAFVRSLSGFSRLCFRADIDANWRRIDP